MIFYMSLKTVSFRQEISNCQTASESSTSPGTRFGIIETHRTCTVVIGFSQLICKHENAVKLQIKIIYL